MLNGTIGAIWKYASTTYSHTLSKNCNKKIIRKLHRQMLLSACRSYRTVSYLALTIINNWPPMDYEIHARTILYLHLHDLPYANHSPLLPLTPDLPSKLAMKKFQLERMIEIWQEEWDNHTTTGQWTKKLIPKVHTGPQYLTFWVTQMLTGHGCFEAYLFRHNRRNNPNCKFCPHNHDDAEHALFHCPLLNNKRPPINQLVPHKIAFRGFVTQLMKHRWDYEQNEQTTLNTQPINN